MDSLLRFLFPFLFPKPTQRTTLIALFKRGTGSSVLLLFTSLYRHLSRYTNFLSAKTGSFFSKLPFLIGELAKLLWNEE